MHGLSGIDSSPANFGNTVADSDPARLFFIKHLLAFFIFKLFKPGDDIIGFKL